MSEKLADVDLHVDEQVPVSASLPKENVQKPKKKQVLVTISRSDSNLLAPKKKQKTLFWPVLGGLLVLGLLILGMVTYVVSNWFGGLQLGATAVQQLPSITTLNVQRSAPYADLNFTLLNVQSATSFSNDQISASAEIARVMLRVANPNNSTIDLTYYDVARLLIPHHQPIAPTNLSLSATLVKKSSQVGWIDFPVAAGVKLSALKFQLGNAATHELLVTIPVSGPYKAEQYADHMYRESLTIQYFFQGYQIPGYWLVYHLTSIDVRNSYNGMETRAGDQFYVLNFSVDNNNGVLVQPGYGYDYIRLELNPNRPPIDNSLPYGFKANAQGVTGHVTYNVPAGLKTLNIAFLYQAVAGWQTYTVSL